MQHYAVIVFVCVCVHASARAHARVCTCVCVFYSRCKEPMLNLMDSLLRKVLMNFNLTELTDLDDDRLDDDVSDSQRGMTCINTFGRRSLLCTELRTVHM